eukprot:CAMPEP_0168426728 /NCGR_PEP_ID=MMETSP0228-20121227/35983_1 /TAXON_ID=133427 /ORGANISM="Protoceratium reticulatum, Strain CCCM 535 (=CCMP 1889)" /LENGTH=56 /DNA_ID=CAMNT_0008440749 /DNA_START=96 /DNA_END=263 /DNA_ORIENTATION=-
MGRAGGAQAALHKPAAEPAYAAAQGAAAELCTLAECPVCELAGVGHPLPRPLLQPP